MLASRCAAVASLLFVRFQTCCAPRWSAMPPPTPPTASPAAIPVFAGALGAPQGVLPLPPLMWPFGMPRAIAMGPASSANTAAEISKLTPATPSNKGGVLWPAPTALGPLEVAQEQDGLHLLSESHMLTSLFS